jgi:hypothetical protein
MPMLYEEINTLIKRRLTRAYETGESEAVVVAIPRQWSR